MTAKSVLMRPKACAPGRMPHLAPLAAPLGGRLKEGSTGTFPGPRIGLPRDK